MTTVTLSEEQRALWQRWFQSLEETRRDTRPFGTQVAETLGETDSVAMSAHLDALGCLPS